MSLCAGAIVLVGTWAPHDEVSSKTQRKEIAMFEAILAEAEVGVTPGVLMAIVMLALYVFIFALVIICLIRVARYFGTAGKEQKLMRMEMGKLAEEVHLLRHELEDGKKQESSTESG